MLFIARFLIWAPIGELAAPEPVGCDFLAPEALFIRAFVSLGWPMPVQWLALNSLGSEALRTPENLPFCRHTLIGYCCLSTGWNSGLR